MLSLFYFSLGWILVLYLFNSAIAREFKKINLPVLLAYVSSVVVLGVFGEVLIGSLYEALFNTPLWQYHLLPIHGAYTSYYSLVIWSMYGFYLYLLHDNIGSRVRSSKALAAVISVEAILLEILLNLSYLVIFGGYIFYYLPSDLWHITSIQAIPFYFLAGLLIVRLVRHAKTDPYFFAATNLILVFTFVLLA
jgi:hypothetical protein